MSKTSPPVFHPRGRWRGQDRKHRPAERIFFSAPRNSSRALLHVTPAIYYTHVYIYIYFPSVLACTMAVFHRYLSHSGTGCTAPAFTIGFQREVPLTKVELQLSFCWLPSVVSRSPYLPPTSPLVSRLPGGDPLFSGPAFHSLPPIRIHLTDFGDRLGGEAIGSSFICPRPRRERRKNKKGKEDLGDLPESGMCIIRDPMKATCEQPFPNFCILLFFFFLFQFVQFLILGLFCKGSEYARTFFFNVFKSRAFKRALENVD